MRRHIDYAISDSHGRADLLMSLVLACVEDALPRNAEARFNFLGDIIDRGPRSRDCLDIVAETLSLYEGSIALRGNHEDMALDVVCEDEPGDEQVERWMNSGGMATLESYSYDIEAGLEMLRTLNHDHVRLMQDASTYQQRGRFLLVHAGIAPGVALSEQTHKDLTRIRAPFLDHIGYLDSIVVHGHTIVGDLPVVTENRISIDTGAYRSGRLTACAIGEHDVRFLQTDGSGRSVVAVEPVLLDRGLGTCLDVPMALAA